MSTRAEEATLARAARPGWVMEYYADTQVVHHVPIADLEDHARFRCKCGARRTKDDGACVVVDGAGLPVKWMIWHNAFDGRDLVSMVEAGIPLSEPNTEAE